MRTINTTKLSKQYILSKVSQVTIFATYLNLSDKIVQYCIDTGELICSPIREDNHPTCGFKYDNKNKLKFRDFAGYFWGDCFDIVCLVINNLYNQQYNINNKEDFIKILRHITLTFKDIFYGKERDINLINDINTSIINIKHQKPIIELVVRDWNKDDENYWKQFGVSINFLNINFVYPVEQYYINKKANPKPKYFYNSKDPCYGYLLGQDRKTNIYNIKLYFPKRSKNTIRFITNCNHLEGIYNLDKTNYDIIVITKSTKDRLSIGEAVYRYNSLYGRLNIGIINIPHETYKLRQNEYDWLNSKLSDNGKIVSLMDNDRTGKIEAIWLKYNYNIIPIIISAKYKAKDFAELVSISNFNDINKYITQTIKYIDNYEQNNKYFQQETKWDDDMPF